MGSRRGFIRKMLGAVAAPVVVSGKLMDAACPVALKFKFCKEVHGMRSHGGSATGSTGTVDGVHVAHSTNWSEFECRVCGRRFEEKKEKKLGELVRHKIEYLGRVRNVGDTGMTGSTG
jgi:hypothetical protein